MEIGRVIFFDGETATLQIDDDFLEFLVDVIRGEKKLGTSQPGYEQDYQDGLGSVIRFGKHKGKTWKDIKESDPSYLEWAANNVERIPEWFKKILRGEDTDNF